MAITILERLHDVKPNGRKIHVKNKSLQVIYDLVRKHMAEIEEAQARGYSWEQIDEACREAWQEDSKLASSVFWWKSSTLIADCYRAIKKGKATKPVATKTAPLSFEVTVTKQ